MKIFIYLESLLYNISELYIKIGKNIFFTSSHTLYFKGTFYAVCAQICHLLKQVMGEGQVGTPGWPQILCCMNSISSILLIKKCVLANLYANLGPDHFIKHLNKSNCINIMHRSFVQTLAFQRELLYHYTLKTCNFLYLYLRDNLKYVLESS